MDLQNELKNLGAMHTMDAGNYGTSKSFRDSIKDMDGQERLLVQDKDVRTMDQMSRLIADADEEWQADPHDPGKIMKLVEILVKTEQPDYENRAIDLLQEAYKNTRQFRFRQNIGKIRMAQMNRMERSLRQAVQANPQDQDARQQYAQFVQEKTNEELEEYKLWSENYPTDANFRYQVAIRLYSLQKFDEAIPVLQQVRQDPKLKTDATIILGRSFLDAGYTDEAVDTLASVLSEYVHKGDKKSIDMTYWYGRALEQKNDISAALKAYSQVAQWDFNYKDVQGRIKKLRTAQANPQT
jgi:thioredoxin-like negative regulator of GroEL